jgi:hypothetical protein
MRTPNANAAMTSRTWGNSARNRVLREHPTIYGFAPLHPDLVAQRPIYTCSPRAPLQRDSRVAPITCAEPGKLDHPM